MEAWFHSSEELLSFLRGRLSSLAGIRRAEPLQVVKVVKHTCDWSAAPPA